MKNLWMALLLMLGLVTLTNQSIQAKEHGNGKGKGNDKEQGDDNDQGKDKDHPPGWDKGKKKGWKSDVPPGWDKKSDDEKHQWKKDLEDAQDEVAKTAKAKGVKDEEKDKAKDVVEICARRGKDVSSVKKQVQDAINAGKAVWEVLQENGIEIHYEK